MKKQFVNDLQEGQQVRDLFLLVRKSLAETKAGKPYLSLTLMDRTGEVEGRVWDNAVALDRVAGIGDIVQLQGMAKPYQQNMQLVISDLRKMRPDQVDLTDFMPASPRSIREMRRELSMTIAEVANPDLRQLMERLFSGSLLEQFCTAPAAKKMHHAYIGGLLEHTLSVAGMAKKTCDHYGELDRDLLISGALVHDIAKTREFSYEAPPFDYTDSGRLLGHLVMGVEMVREAARELNVPAPETLDALCHLILSHHGRHEFGAPVLPMMPEAIMLHHLDDMDAKMNYIGQLRNNMEESGWTGYQRPLERFLFLTKPSDPVESVPEGDDEGARMRESETVHPAGVPQADRSARRQPQEAGAKQQSLFGALTPPVNKK
jgi:3'-5' exoribonuclease